VNCAFRHVVNYFVFFSFSTAPAVTQFARIELYHSLQCEFFTLLWFWKPVSPLLFLERFADLVNWLVISKLLLLVVVFCLVHLRSLKICAADSRSLALFVISF